jgi:mannose-1-phosphate guanylyltransferase
VPLLGPDTLLDATLRRIAHVAAPGRRWVLASAELAPLVRRALRRHPGVRLLVEPWARNTGPAIAWAAAHVAAQRDGGLLGIFPADHFIPDGPAFARSVRRAARAASSSGDLVLIGIEPARPDTAYGYLRLGRRHRSGAAPVVRFEEKPKLARARRFLASGRYLWNAGMLVAPPARVLAETRAHAPDIWGALGGVLERVAAGDRAAAPAVRRAFARTPRIAFDYAVLEHSRRVRAVRAGFLWSDVGSWDALAELLPRSGRNRVLARAPALVLAGERNVIWNTTPLPTVLLGISGVAVVLVDDVLLVCGLDRAQELRRVADELSRRGRADLL